MAQNLSDTPGGYAELLDALKTRIREARVRAALAVNRELVLLYWSIGADILGRQEQQGWGAGVIERLAKDLKASLPDAKGFSARNLKYMRALAQAWPDRETVQAVLARIPWYLNLALLEKLDRPEDRLWYARQAFENGWSRNVLVHHIETKLVERKGSAPTNFEHTLPAPQSDLAREALKDPYTFDFLDLADDALERDLERGLLENLQRFMLELGRGFAFVGNQYALEVDGDEFFIDLLFFHIPLSSYVAIELKTGKFKPEYAGQLGFYLTAIDKQLKQAEHGSSIGLLLCKEKSSLVVEYALQDSTKPMGVAEYRVLPADLRKDLPSVEELHQVVRGSGVMHAPRAQVRGTGTVTPPEPDRGSG